MKKTDFTLDQLYHLTINSEYVALDGKTIREVMGAVRLDLAVQKGWQEKFLYHDLYRTIEWKWMSERGVLAKRIAKWYHDTYNSKLLPETSTAIGSIVRKSVLKDQTYHFDFTQNFDWNSGAYGDSGSCFMNNGHRADILQSMRTDKRFHAVRFFNAEESNLKINPATGVKYKEEKTTACIITYTGHSRAWLVKDQVRVPIGNKDNVVNEDILIIFNGYGLGTKVISSVLSSAFGLAFHPVTVTNNKGLHGGLYLNDDKCYILGDHAVIKNIERYDFGLPYSTEDCAGASKIVLKGEPDIIKKDPIRPPVQLEAIPRIEDADEIMAIMEHQEFYNNYQPIIPDEAEQRNRIRRWMDRIGGF